MYYKMHIWFFKKVLIILKQSTKQANFWLGMQYPLIKWQVKEKISIIVVLVNVDLKIVIFYTAQK